MPTLTTTRGETFDSPYETNEAAMYALEIALHPHAGVLRSNSFAINLRDQYARRGRLSDAQWPYVHRLVLEARGAFQNESPEAPAVNVASIVRLLRQAHESGLSRPQIRLQVGGNDVRFKFASGGRVPGSVNVTANNGDWGDGMWQGRLMPDGEWKPARNPWGDVQELIEGLAELSLAQTRDFIAANGRHSGACQFCRRPLSTDESLTAGYGPVCADRFGLPWGHVSEQQVSRMYRRGSNPATRVAVVSALEVRSAADRRRNPADADDEWI